VFNFGSYKKNNLILTFMKLRVCTLIVLFLAMSSLYAQPKGQKSIPMIGSLAPSFTAETTDGILNFPGDYGKSWKILFSHPKDFTPVCTHEILHLALIQDQLKNLDVKVVILSTDTKETHQDWKESMEEILSKRAVPVKIEFPFIDDPKAEIANLYGMIHEGISPYNTIRGLFIIDPDNIIQTVVFYPPSVGRSLEEMVRKVQALQTVRASGLYTPANWQPYNDLLVPHYRYNEEELKNNPELMNDYYQIGSYLWYKKIWKE
jgi:peroxiredoxin 2/4